MKFLFLISFIFINSLIAQEPTVGCIFNTTEAEDNLSLLSVLGSNEIYLVDNCGYIFNRWESDYPPGLSVKLDSNGNLYRAGKTENDVFFNGGGAGGIIEKFNWDGDLIWKFELSNDSMIFHHDFEILENGNLLVLLWKKISKEEAVKLGRKDSLVNQNGFWGEIVQEIKPIDFDRIDLKWEWSMFDHLIQDHSENEINYGTPTENPGCWDINLGSAINTVVDFLHVNSIDYSKELDQILLSSRELNEIYIIDKSTSTLEAKTDTGGNSNKGGRILFRWGNPYNYTRDTTHKQSLFNQHDARWIEDTSNDEYRVSVFNNGSNRIGEKFSSIEEILIREENYNYDFLEKEKKQEEDIIWSYVASDTTSFYSKHMSGAKKLNNGNFIITESTKGKIFEIDRNKLKVREYIVPYTKDGPITQFDFPVANTLFKAENYAHSFFNEQIDLKNSFEKIELKPIDECSLVSNLVDSYSDLKVNYFVLNNELRMKFNVVGQYQIHLYDVMGNLFLQKSFIGESWSIDLRDFPQQLIYMVKITERRTNKNTTIKVPRYH